MSFASISIRVFVVAKACDASAPHNLKFSFNSKKEVAFYPAQNKPAIHAQFQVNSRVHPIVICLILTHPFTDLLPELGWLVK